MNLADDIMLTTDRLVLRKPQAQDWPAMRDFYLTDRSYWVGGPKEPEASWRGWASDIGHWEMRGFGGWVAVRKDTGAAIGRFGPYYPIEWPEKEIGWSLWDASLEGQGYAFEAAKATLAHAFTILGWTTAVSYVHANNAPSARLAERLGAVLDGDAARPQRDFEVLVYRHNPAKVLA
ncbi:GNAT family N-acetyltransferase [Ketogulonicigenium vulgare]|uniref:GNAT family N-acetyltransferase n=1 Tax=Ketogulonicigenium vulgare TaxID=92945 RepID=UPI002358E212|nr:GNAT family N-acetyltransferase [Ketogulonicigenium vulgare]